LTEIDAALQKNCWQKSGYDTIYVLGETGAGKSTLIDFLLKSNLTYQYDEALDTYKI
jgi:type IV secretory pathway VirB4 component